MVPGLRVVSIERRNCGNGSSAPPSARATPDLYSVNFEVNDLKPFPHLAFPHSKGPRTPSKLPSFDGELMASFSDLARPMSAMAMLQQLSGRRNADRERHGDTTLSGSAYR